MVIIVSTILPEHRSRMVFFILLSPHELWQVPFEVKVIQLLQHFLIISTVMGNPENNDTLEEINHKVTPLISAESHCNMYFTVISQIVVFLQHGLSINFLNVKGFGPSLLPLEFGSLYPQGIQFPINHAFVMTHTTHKAIWTSFKPERVIGYYHSSFTHCNFPVELEFDDIKVLFSCS